MSVLAITHHHIHAHRLMYILYFSPEGLNLTFYCPPIAHQCLFFFFANVTGVADFFADVTAFTFHNVTTVVTAIFFDDVTANPSRIILEASSHILFEKIFLSPLP